MANFLDVLNAVTASLGGLAQITNQQAKEREQRDLEGAKLLAATKDYTLAPVAPGTVQRPGFLQMLGGSRGQTPGGQGVFRLGNTLYAAQPVGTIASSPGVAGLGTLPMDKPTAPQPQGGVLGRQESLIPQPYPVPPRINLGAQQPQTDATPTTTQPLTTAQPSESVSKALLAASKQAQVPPEHLFGLSAVESNFDPNAEGPVTRFGWRAGGLMQLSPDTGKRFGVTNFFNEAENANGGAFAWKEALQKANGDIRTAYNTYYNPHASEADTNKVVAAIGRFRQILAPGSLQTALPSTPSPSLTETRGSETQAQPTSTPIPAASVQAMRAQRARLVNQQQNQNLTPEARNHAATLIEQIDATLASSVPQSPLTAAVAGPGAPAPQPPTAASTPEQAAAWRATLPQNQPATPPLPGMSQAASAQEPTPQAGEVYTTGEPATMPSIGAVMGQRLAKTPAEKLTITSPYGPVLRDLAMQGNALITQAQQNYRNTREGEEEFAKFVRQTWKDRAASTQEFYKARDEMMKQFPTAEAGLKDARSWQDLYQTRDEIPAKAQIEWGAFANIMEIAATGNMQQVGNAIAWHGAHGVSTDMLKHAAEASGYSRTQKTAQEVESIRTTAGPKAQAAETELRLTGPIRTAQEVEKQERLATSPAIRQGEADKASAVARAQEAERPRGTDVFLQAADDVLAIAKRDGALPPKATIKDLAPEQRDAAHVIEAHRQGLIKQATANLVIDTPVTRKEDLTGYINPLTGQRPRIGMTPRQIAESNMLPVTEAGAKTLDLRLEAKQHLKEQRLRAFGGVDTDGIINGIPGEKIKGFLAESPPGTVNRAKETVAMRLAALSQKDRGRLATIFDRNQAGFAGIIGRGLGGQGGQFTENDRIFSESLTGISGLRGMKMADARETMETQFRMLDTH